MLIINERVKALIIGLVSFFIAVVILIVINIKDTNEENYSEVPSVPNASEEYNKEEPKKEPEQIPEQNEPEEEPVVPTPVPEPEQKPEPEVEVQQLEEPKEEEPVVDNQEEFTEHQKEVLRLVNIERTKRNLKPLTLDFELSKVATIKSQDMIDRRYFDHNSPTYGSPFDMMKRFGVVYGYAGENIAMGKRTPREVVNAWMNSPGHRANILNPNYTALGIGAVKDSKGRIYWTQMFISE